MRRGFDGRRGLRLVLLGGLALWVAGALPACDAAEEDEPCLSTMSYFTQKVWLPILSQDCISCHSSQGEARDSMFVLQSAAQPGYIEANFETIREVAAFTYDGESVLLLRPSMRIAHPGGLRFERGSDEYDAIAELVRRFDEPVACEEEVRPTVFSGVAFLDADAVLRKASLALVGRLPTAAEEQAVAEGGEEALDQVLLAMMEEDAFLDRVREIYNDRLLTDRYLPNDDAVNLLDAGAYPNRRWWDDDDYEVSSEIRALGDRYANASTAREPLDLIAWIVKNDRPFTEVVTADYTVVTPLTARVYGVEDQVTFSDPLDPTELVTTQIPGVPHAGVLTSPMFLNRFPTTATNRNRHRSRMVYDFFLGSDVLKLAERPIDPTSITDHNPTMFNPNCSVCHAVIDPMAGAFQNWDAQGRFRPPEEGWHSDMRPPGFGESVLPVGRYGDGLAWVAERIAREPTFARGALNILFEGLTGKPPLPAPADQAAPDFDAQQRAYDDQEAVLRAIAEEFEASGFNLKVLVRGIIRSEFFRASDLLPDVELDGTRAAELAGVGMGRLLTPEQLNRKVEAVTGYPWRRRANDRDYLLGDYRIFYGGIDSNEVTKRITDPNGIMANVAWRMANDMACRAVPLDLTKNRAERTLLPHVELSYTPEDDNGFEIAGAVLAIKRNLQHLHHRLLGEELELSDPELDRTWRLFLETWREGTRAVEAGDASQDLPQECRATVDFWTGEDIHPDRRVSRDTRYTVRAWMAVMTYLLSDFRFLYE